MGCEGLLAQLWKLKNKEMVRELTATQPNHFNNTIRNKLEEWTAGVWRKAYFVARGKVALP